MSTFLSWEHPGTKKWTGSWEEEILKPGRSETHCLKGRRQCTWDRFDLAKNLSLNMRLPSITTLKSFSLALSIFFKFCIPSPQPPIPNIKKPISNTVTHSIITASRLSSQTSTSTQFEAIQIHPCFSPSTKTVQCYRNASSY